MFFTAETTPLLRKDDGRKSSITVYSAFTVFDIEPARRTLETDS
jgi:hypothetical protein